MKTLPLLLAVLGLSACATVPAAETAPAEPVTVKVVGLNDFHGNIEPIRRTLRLPDVFQDHDSPDKQYDAAGLNAPHIVDAVLKALRHNSAGVEEARA